jgi:hypothetical protein
MKSNRFKKPLIITIAVILALFLAGLIGTPYLIDLGLERWIASQGPEIGKVENIDFNPFTGRLSMDNLVVETQSGRTLNITHAYLQFSWKQLFKKQLYLSELVLQETYMLVDRLDESGFRVGGLILNELIGKEKKSDAPGWEVGIGHFELQDSSIEYDTPELAATYFIDRYTLRGLETWNKQKPVDMEFSGRIDDSPLQAKAEIKPLAAIKSWNGNIKLENGSLELFAKLEGLQGYAPSGSIDLDLHLDMQIQEDITIDLTADGTAKLKQLHIKYEKYILQQEQIAWQGSITGNQSAEQGLALAIDGKLTGTDLAVDDSAAFLDLLLGAIDWQGKAEVRLQKEDMSVKMTADMDVTDINAKDKKHDVNLLGLEKFNLAGIEIAGLEDIQVSQIDLQDLRLVDKRSKALKTGKEEAQPLLMAAVIKINKTSLQNTTEISIDTIELQDLAADIRRDKEGNWQVIPPLAAPSESPAPQPTPKTGEADEGSRPLTFRINSLQAGGKNYIRFADESLYRPFKATFQISELELGDINSAGPGSSSRFKVKGKVGDYGELAFDGMIKPEDKPVSLDMKGDIGALDMVPFSSYTGQTIGYNVTSGQMDADITMKIDKGMMDGIFDLRMRNLEVAQVDPEKMPEIDNQMDVPLGSALAMLRNKKDEIKLKLELEGDIKSPEFGIQDAINQALAKAMQFATLSYLKYTLQPFGTYIAIAEVVGKAGKEMSKVGLDPVLFPAGEIVLDETANQYLEKIKELLDNRPKLRIELCGRAVEKDRAALIERRLAAQKKEGEKSGKKLDEATIEITIADEVLLDFAKERAKLVKESLVKEHSIDHERIFVCLPEIDKDSAKDPYVEMRLD